MAPSSPPLLGRQDEMSRAATINRIVEKSTHRHLCRTREEIRVACGLLTDEEHMANHAKRVVKLRAALSPDAYQLALGRQTGKTTRMMLEALVLATSGKRVLILAATDRLAHSIRWQIRQLSGRAGIPTRDLIRVDRSCDRAREMAIGWVQETLYDHYYQAPAESVLG